MFVEPAIGGVAVAAGTFGMLDKSAGARSGNLTGRINAALNLMDFVGASPSDGVSARL